MGGGFWSMFYSEDGKTWSSQRVVAVAVSILWTVVICGAWGLLSLKKGEIQPINDSITLIYSSVLGIVLGAKVVNSIFGEKRSSIQSGVEETPVPKE